MSTTMVTKETVTRKWYVLDAAGKPMGKTAALAADRERRVSDGSFRSVRGMDRVTVSSLFGSDRAPAGPVAALRSLRRHLNSLSGRNT